MSLIAFIGHDPGALQLIRPIYERACHEPAFDAIFVNLRAPDAPKPGDSIPRDTRLCVLGASTNQYELQVIQHARRRGIRTLMMIELTYMQARMPNLRWSEQNFADRYIVTTPASVPLLRAHLVKVGGPNDLALLPRVEALGSPHLEAFAASLPAKSPREVRRKYGVPVGSPIVVLVGFPEASRISERCDTDTSISIMEQ